MLPWCFVAHCYRGRGFGDAALRRQTLGFTAFGVPTVQTCAWIWLTVVDLFVECRGNEGGKAPSICYH